MMNKRQKKKRFKQTHIGISPEMWSIYEENRKRWMASIIFREYANLLELGNPRSVAVEKLKERLGAWYGIVTDPDPIYKKQKLDREDIVGGRNHESINDGRVSEETPGTSFED